MIQRIQSLYLLVVAILFVSVLFCPIMNFSQAETMFELTINGIEKINSNPVFVLMQTPLLTALCFIIVVISILTIFCYKNRILQLRLTIFNIVLMVGYYALLAVYLYVATKDYGVKLYPRLGIIFPLIGAILSYLAFRAIAKDEALVQSLNRLR